MLDDESRERTEQGVSDALDVLAALGYRSSPAIPAESVDAATAPAATSSGLRPFRRVGEVVAKRSQTSWTWSAEDGNVLRGNAGDWHVTDEAGRSWSVKPEEFEASYAAIGDDRWRRTGIVNARPGLIGEQIATLEGITYVNEESWVLQSPSGARWIVPAARFHASYLPLDASGSTQ